ncbi:MAG: N-acetyltransferase [Phycisphaerae bacterium]|nr:N-acetyltransferase [Phycisphaerae bacterium]
MNITIRNETDSDVNAISEITKAAFADCLYGNHTEQFIITALRAAGALTVSLVAEADSNVVGHVAFSPVTVSDGTLGWYGLGPVSVLPSLQKQGIGKSLIREGLSLLKASGAKGCTLVGDPIYYHRFGFKNLPHLVLEGVPQQYFLALPFDETKTSGIVTFHKAFTAEQ